MATFENEGMLLTLVSWPNYNRVITFVFPNLLFNFQLGSIFLMEFITQPPVGFKIGLIFQDWVHS